MTKIQVLVLRDDEKSFLDFIVTHGAIVHDVNGLPSEHLWVHFSVPENDKLNEEWTKEHRHLLSQLWERDIYERKMDAVRYVEKMNNLASSTISHFYWSGNWLDDAKFTYYDNETREYKYIYLPGAEMYKFGVPDMLKGNWLRNYPCPPIPKLKIG